MDEKQFKELVAQVGKEAAEKIKAEMDGYKAKTEEMVKGHLTEAQFKEHQAAIEESVEVVKGIAAKQGTTINEILAKLNTSEIGAKSIAEVLQDDTEELKSVFKSRNMYKEYMISVNAKGKLVMMPFDSLKAAGPHATTTDVGAGGNASSVTQAIDATTLLRLGADATVMSAFRNTPWVFGLCNLINAGFNNPYYIWFDELTKAGASAQVAEGGTKPTVQYKYQLNTSTYKKEALLVGFTDEFNLDFERLQSEIMNVAQIDLINRINAAILPNITAAATAFNIGATYAPVGDLVAAPNDWDVLAALAAQVETSTFATMANAAVISTMKKYRMGTQKDTQNRWLDRPSVLANVGIVSNPGQGANDVMVGDFKQYNIALRGGIIVRVGYNGTDFAENRFSTVVEQYYFDYISNARKPAIVKGPDFATVKAAITA
jgi:hypothetical protein